MIRIDEDETGRRVVVVADDGSEEAVAVSARAHLEVVAGQEVAPGDALVDGPKDPKELLEIKGIRETQQYLVEEVQKVYRDQGVSIHDKHIELIVRQMLRRVLVAEPGDAPFLPGERVDNQRYAAVNRELVQAGKRPAEGRPELMGITKASLATDSWLSAASFQETTTGAHRGRDRVQVRPAVRAQGEHHHRQAHPRGHGHDALSQRRGGDAGRRAHVVLVLGPRRRRGRQSRAPTTWPRGCATSGGRPSAARTRRRTRMRQPGGPTPASGRPTTSR